MKRVILCALILIAVSCEQSPREHCYECQTAHTAYKYGYTWVDTLCGMTEQQARAYEVMHHVDNDSITTVVHCVEMR